MCHHCLTLLSQPLNFTEQKIFFFHTDHKQFSMAPHLGDYSKEVLWYSLHKFLLRTPRIVAAVLLNKRLEKLRTRSHVQLLRLHPASSCAHGFLGQTLSMRSPNSDGYPSATTTKFVALIKASRFGT